MNKHSSAIEKNITESLAKNGTNWIANDINASFWNVAKLEKNIEVDSNTPKSHLTEIIFSKKISSFGILTDEIYCNIFADLQQCLKNTFESNSISKPYQLANINRNIISFIVSVNECRELNDLPPILALNQITEEDFFDFMESFQTKAEQFYAVVDELKLITHQPTNKDWENINSKLKLRSKTFSIIKARIKASKLKELYISNSSTKKEFDDANISRGIHELTLVNKKTVQNITSDLEHLFNNSQDLKFPINFSPYETLGGEEGLATLFDGFQNEVKTAAMPLETAFHLISQSMKFQINYGPSLLKYLKDIDLHYKNRAKYYAKSTLLKECYTRERLFLIVKCPVELISLNISILGLEHEVKRDTSPKGSISLVNAIQLHLASMYILLLAYLATREFSILLLKRNCFEHSPLDGLCDVKFKQQKASTFNLLETIHRPIPAQIYELGLQYCEFSQYLEERYGINHDDENSYLFTNFHNAKKLITRHFCPSDDDFIPEHLYSDTMQSCLNHFSDWSGVPLIDEKRWYATEHQFRRLFAILYFSLTNEEGIEELSWFLGHENLEMTFGYAEIHPSSEWMDEAIISIAKRAVKINENLNVDKAISNIVELAKEKSIKLNLQLEDVVYHAINERIKKTGEEVHFKRCDDKTIYFYFTEGANNA
ncbi:hypothetical protein [Colwellia sp. Bg11-28]|uniref:hypothetical protein n=1 Tax=Colwellia sp. Bg11-28 TaxID=2058305 RepID=UPI000C3323D3|nr:hypothetical protein [Colwellia sp. Bg11-28]PKH86882.1 hypothetical protein CXF79_09100 [Colwellia sp. Bg11-28]